MSDLLLTVVVPTLNAGPVLLDCVRSLESQTWNGFEIVIVDNSGDGAAQRSLGEASRARVIACERNLGFGAALNLALRRTSTPYLATLNDDAVAHPQWLEKLVAVIERRPDVGMCAPQVRLAGQDRLDSAGMLLCGDGSSRQRGHLEPPSRYTAGGEVLFASGSAALYRRQMLEELGGFDESFFLYCEDTDMGLRARWAGWKCLYVPEAVVEHRYSHSAGRASRLKAYYVERNRLFVMIKNFPARMLLRAPAVTLARYLHHSLFLLRGRGVAAEFQRQGHAAWRLPWYAVRGHLAMLAALPRLLRQRRAIRRNARIDTTEFHALARRHSISPRELAAL